MSNKGISMMNISSSFGAKKRGAEGGSQQAGVQMDTDSEQAGPSSKEVTVPPKKPKMSGPKSSMKHSTSGSSSLVPTESTQPGRAAGPQPGGATGPQPGRAAGPHPGGATGPQPGRAAGPQPGRAAGPQPGRAAGPQPGGATGPHPGGAAGPQLGRAKGPHPGGAKGPQPGGAKGPHPGGAKGPQPGGAKGPQPGGAKGPHPGGAKGPQPGGAKGPHPGGAKGPQPGGAAGPQPGRAKGPQPGGAKGPHPGGAKGPHPGGAKGPQPGGAAGPQTFKCNQRKVKEENDGDPRGEHLHRFTVKFSPTDSKKYNITCNRPRTVLKAIKSTQTYNKGVEMEMCADENIVIQLGKEDKASIVPTHFPCTCIREGESLIISHKSDVVEAAQNQLYKPIQSRDKYSVFYINTEGGENTKTKRLFRSNAVKQFKYLVVYGKKGMTVEEALKRDGRFIDDLGDFKLSDSKNPSHTFENTEKVDTLDRKKLKLCLPRKKKTKGQPADQQANQYTSQSSPAAWYTFNCNLC